VLNRKHIRAPKTHDPGFGRPKEHLAYINKAEAEMLRVLTDGVVERGPKGIPSYASFAGTSGTGYSSGYKGPSSSASATKTSSVGGIGSAAKSGSSSMTKAASGSTASKSPSGGSGNYGGSNNSGGSASSGVGSAAKSGASSMSSAGGGGSKANNPSGGMSGGSGSGGSARTAPSAGAVKSSGGFSQSQFGGGSAKAPSAAAKPSGGFSQSQFGGGSGNFSAPPVRGPAGSLAAAKDSEKRAAAAAMAPTAADLARRASAVSRGPGPLTGYRPEAIARTVAFGESPAGIRVPGLASSLRKAALDNQQLFSMSGATPEQQALLGQIGSSALHVAMRTGLDPRTVLGQAMTESTTGRHDSKVSALARNANNLFGIKGRGKRGENWDGSVVRMPTKEVINGQTVTMREPFRSYPTPNQSVLDYGNLIERRYSGAANAETVEGQLARIRGGGYATHAPTGYVRMGVNNANRLSVGGEDTSGTQLPDPTQRATGGFQTAAEVSRLAQPAGPPPRPTARPWTAPPKPNPRPPQPPTAGRGVTVPTAPPQQPPRQAAGTYTAPYDVAPPPRPTARPPSQNMQRPLAGDPRVSMPPGSYPAAMAMPPRPTARPPSQNMQRPVGGMSFTPGLPGMQKQMYDRVPQEQGPQPQYNGQERPGRVASGTYTAPYDVAAPRAPALGGIGSPGLPPGYAERYGLDRPAQGAEPSEAASAAGPTMLDRGVMLARNALRGDYRLDGNAIRQAMVQPDVKKYAEAPGWQKAVAGPVFGALYGDDVRKGAGNIIRAGQDYIRGLTTPPPKKEAKAESRKPEPPGGGYTDQPDRQPTDNPPKPGSSKSSRFPENSKGDRQTEREAKMKERRKRLANALDKNPAAAQLPPQPGAEPDMSYYTNVMSREEALRRLLGEEWYA